MRSSFCRDMPTCSGGTSGRPMPTNAGGAGGRLSCAQDDVQQIGVTRTSAPASVAPMIACFIVASLDRLFGRHISALAVRRPAYRQDVLGQAGERGAVGIHSGT